jgi:hypothetical protein
MTDSVKNLVSYCRENERICPLPKFWKQLWEMLPNRKRIGVGWSPSLPLILAAWDAPAEVKMVRLVEHIEWAAKHGALETVSGFLRELREEDWHHETVLVTPLHVRDRWEEGFEVLKRFKMREGHCRVSNRHKEGDYRLGAWVGTQRGNKDSLSPERVQRLDEIGLVWDARVPPPTDN